MRILSLILIAGLLMPALLSSCGRMKAPVDDLPSLEGIPLEDGLAMLIGKSYDIMKKDEGASAPLEQDLLRFHELGEAIERTDSRREAGDSLYTLWRADPENFLWIDLASGNNHLLRRTAERDSLYALPALADTSAAVGRYLFARRFYRRPGAPAYYLRAWEERESLTALQRAILDLKASRALASLGKTERGLDLLLDSIPRLARLGGAPLRALAWSEIAHRLWKLDRKDDALHATELSIRWARAADLGRLELETLLDLAALLTEKGLYGGAHELLGQTAELARERRLPRTRLKAQNRLTFLLLELGETRRALAINQASAALCVEMDEAHYAPRIWLNVAEGFMALGLMDSCRTALDEAKCWAESYPHFQTDWTVLAAEADWQLLSGNLATADSLRRLAAAADPEMRLRGEEVRRLLTVVEHGREMGRPALAFAALRELESEGIDFLEKMPGQDLALDYLLSAAGLRTEVGEFDRAAAFLAEASERLDGSRNPLKQSRYWSMMAELADARSDRRRSMAARDSSLQHAEAAGNPGLIARQALLRGRGLLDAGRVDEARRQFEQVGGDLNRSPSFRTVILRRLMLGLTDMAEGKSKAAAERFSRTLDEGDRGLGDDLRLRLLIELGRAESSRGNAREAEAALRRARDLILSSGNATGGSELRRISGDALRDAYSSLIILLATGPRHSGNPDPATLTYSLLLEMRALENGLTAAPPAAAEGPNLAFLLEEEACFQWISAQGQVRLRRLPSLEEIGRELHRLHLSLAQAGRDSTPESARRLADWLLAPIGDDWSAGVTLGVLADGPLYGLPWPILPWRSAQVLDHAPVVERVMCVSARDRPSKSDRLLAIGFNPGGDELGGLRQAEKEASDLAALWPGEVDLRIGGQAAEAFPPEPGGDYRAIHIATHALVNQTLANRASLHLASNAAGDAPIGAEDIAELELSADLVFLSTCEAARSGRSRGAAVLDLAGAFRRAGAGAVIAASMPVEDRASRELSLAFYRHWLAGADKAEALRRAQKELRDESASWAHPHYWAYFRLSE